jgi:gamma-glutamylcyclotransferase (GGCT)/AIG2-like uncharacterized protein YtfP
MVIRVFVYGTLKPGEIYYQQLCDGKISDTQPAITQGDLYSLPMGYPAMTFGQQWVHGYVLTFSEPQLLAQLDELEGYHPDRPLDQNDYVRVTIEALHPHGLELGTTWAYVMNKHQCQQQQGTLIPNGRWISTL